MSESETYRSQRPADTVVEIGGRSYRLKGGDPEHLHRLAAGVDSVLRRVAGPDGPLDSYKVAVLAALNLAADDAERRRRWTRGLWELRRRADSLELRLDRVRDSLLANAGGDPV